MTKEAAKDAISRLKLAFKLGMDFIIRKRRIRKGHYQLWLYAYDQEPGPIGDFPESVLIKKSNSYEEMLKAMDGLVSVNT